MSHPRYKGNVIDAHCHYDGSTLAQARQASAQGGLTAAIHLWDAIWPPREHEVDAELWRAEEPRLLRCHVPNVSDIDGSASVRDLDRGVRAAAEHGVVGIKIWKNLGLWLKDRAGRRLAVDDPRLTGVWDAAADLQLPVVIHQGDPPPFFGPLDDANPRIEELRAHPDWWYGGGDFPSLDQIHDELERVVSLRPEVSFIAAHFGSFMSWGDVRRMLRTYPNYHVDTAAAIADMGRAEARDEVRQIIVDYADRVFFGTDLIRTASFDMPEMPAADRWRLRRFFDLHWTFFETDSRDLMHPLPAQGDWSVRGLDLPDGVLARLYWENARTVFRLPAEILELDDGRRSSAAERDS